MIVISTTIACTIYVLLITRLAFALDKVKKSNTLPQQPQTGFSIIVPFRNEAKNLPRLLRSIENLDYPRELFELILVDDNSKDTSQRVYINWRLAHDAIETTLLENLRLSGSPKKDAIARAIPIVKHPWVITTDADCKVEKDWLLCLDGFIRQEKKAAMVAGPVVYQTKNNWFHHFQQYELLALQGVTIGSFGQQKPFLCNGANFAYTKNFFTDLGGFAGINHKASGDDVLLLQKAVDKAPEKVHYLLHDSFIVKTRPENDAFTMFLQRVRWAGKSTAYQSSNGKVVALASLLMNLALVTGFGFALAGILSWKILCAIFVAKYVADYLLLYKTNRLLQHKKILFPLASSLVYPFFSSLCGLYALVFGYRWKGRKFSR